MGYKPKTEAAKTYAQKLRDPRWKSRREEILQRDNYTCRGCGDRDPDPIEDEDGYQEDIDPPEPVCLEVHHKYYEWGNNPWEYPNSALITLCQMCHDTETAYQKEAVQRLTRAIQTRFLSKDIFKLAHAFEFLAAPINDNQRTAKVITWALTEHEAMDTLTTIFEGKSKGLRPASEFLDGLTFALSELNRG